jgi:hypothetical protein
MELIYPNNETKREHKTINTTNRTQTVDSTQNRQNSSQASSPVIELVKDNENSAKKGT